MRSGRWGEVPDENLGVRNAGLRGDLQQLRCDALGHVGLTAVLADVSRHLGNDDGLTAAVERDRWPAVRTAG